MKIKQLNSRRIDLQALGLCTALAAITGASNAFASGSQELSNLMNMSLSDLAAMPVTVTSVSKRPESLRQAASAVYVINQEDIRRSAATSVPELLRMVPGVEVARVDDGKWAISARGGNHEFANKLLVLVDGRSVYSPLFGGVYWDAQSLPLRDIDRIEVIRGPGSSLWGANAMNGVINIITRSAEETQGGVISGHAGTNEQLATLRQGIAIGDQSFLRVWGHGERHDSVEHTSGIPEDDWKTRQIGFRLDSRSGANRWELDGKLYRGSLSDTLVLPELTAPYTSLRHDQIDTEGGHLRMLWERPIADNQNLSLRVYYDRSERERVSHMERLDTVDIEIQHDWRISDNQQWSWGANARHTWDEQRTEAPFKFTDEKGESRLQSLFGQYTHWIADGQGKWVLGSKFSHTNRAGESVQPSLRFSWDLNEHHSFWSSVSRSVRTPTRYEHGARYDAFVFEDPNIAPLPILSITEADGTLSEEIMTAYELGLRNEFSDSLRLDTALFFNQYEDLVALEMGEPFVEAEPQPIHLVVPTLYANYSEATAYGLETSLDWTPVSNWRLAASYSFLDVKLDERPAPNIVEYAFEVPYSPRHQVKVRSFYNFAENWEFDALVFYTDELEGLNVDGYTRLDLRLGWNPMPKLQISAGGKNLLESAHTEFGRSLFAIAGEVERSLYLNAAYAF